MRHSIIALAMFLTASSAFAPNCQVTWTYDRQDLWQGDCQSQIRQSPIDLGHAVNSPAKQLSFSYGNLPFRVMNTTRTAKMKYEDLSSSFVIYDGVRYDLQEIHFHAPAEHKILGRADRMEMHVVHKRHGGSDSLAIGVLFENGPSSVGTLNKIIRATPRTECQTAYPSGTFNPKGTLIPWNDNGPNPWWVYDGSLTTPDCTENVEFIILKRKLRVSDADRQHFIDLFGETARDLKPQREVKQTVP